MYNNFVTIDNKLEEGKYFGQLGLAHIYKEETNGIKWFATHLNDSNSEYKNKVYSIGYNYINCKSVDNSGKNSIDINLMFSLSQETVRADSDFVYIDIEKVDEHYNDFKMLDIFIGEFLEYNVSEYLNGIVQIRNSGASKPLDY